MSNDQISISPSSSSFSQQSKRINITSSMSNTNHVDGSKQEPQISSSPVRRNSRSVSRTRSISAASSRSSYSSKSHFGSRAASAGSSYSSGKQRKLALTKFELLTQITTVSHDNETELVRNGRSSYDNDLLNRAIEENQVESNNIASFRRTENNDIMAELATKTSKNHGNFVLKSNEAYTTTPPVRRSSQSNTISNNNHSYREFKSAYRKLSPYYHDSSSRHSDRADSRSYHSRNFNSQRRSRSRSKSINRYGGKIF